METRNGGRLKGSGIWSVYCYVTLNTDFVCGIGPQRQCLLFFLGLRDIRNTGRRYLKIHAFGAVVIRESSRIFTSKAVSFKSVLLRERSAVKESDKRNRVGEDGVLVWGLRTSNE
jgi:hypothetical protein